MTTGTPISKQLARALRRARARGLEADLSLNDWLQTIDDFEGKCAYCGQPSWTIDHFIALAHGGGITVDNCIPCCLRCNQLKGSKSANKLVTCSGKRIEQIRLYLRERKKELLDISYNPIKQRTDEERQTEVVKWPSTEQTVNKEGDPTSMTIEDQSSMVKLATGETISIQSNRFEIVLDLEKATKDSNSDAVSYFRMRMSLSETTCVLLATELLHAIKAQKKEC